MQEYFKILGVSENATDEEIDAAYKSLKEKYSKERFLEGEVGNTAARNLTKLETAYTEISMQRQSTKKTEKVNVSYDFSEIESLIKNGKIDLAQEKLDNFTDRNAEWHYLQSVVFYKKNWTNESKKQLEIAINMDPYNNKYSTAYSKLKAKMEYNERQFHSGNVNYGNQTTNNYNERQMGDSGCGSFVDCCMTWCCMNLLCNSCMR